MATRGGAVRELVRLITRRSQVQILPPLPENWILQDRQQVPECTGDLLVSGRELHGDLNAMADEAAAIMNWDDYAQTSEACEVIPARRPRRRLASCSGVMSARRRIFASVPPQAVARDESAPLHLALDHSARPVRNDCPINDQRRSPSLKSPDECRAVQVSWKPARHAGT